MLVANPGQTAAYVLHAKKSSSCHSANNNNSNSTNSSSSANTVIGNSTKIAANSLGLKTARHVLANNCQGTGTTISTKTLPLKLAPPTLDNSTTNKYHTNTTSTTNNSNNHHTSATTANSSSSTTTSTSNALMKTLSVRLNRGTEFLKETVHKALISKIPSHLSSVLNLNLYTVPPTVTHRFPAERVNASSADSLQTEMCHFKPIRTAPTTPWKSNSKSRGASIKMPKACLATKVKLDCYDAAGDGTSLEAEGYLQFRPKPNSTLLTTIFTTPSRQSAFVCLVTKMKINSSMKNKQTNSAKQKSSSTKSSRSRTKPKDSVDFSKSSGEALTLSKRNLRKRRSPFVNVKQMNLATELIITRSSIRNRTNSSIAAVEGTKSKSKSKSKLGVSQSHNSDPHTGTQRRARKRKMSNESCNPTPRKSARLSKDDSVGALSKRSTGTGAGIVSHSFACLARRPTPIVQQKRARALFSPPLTRSRLKQLSQQKLNSDQLL